MPLLYRQFISPALNTTKYRALMFLVVIDPATRWKVTVSIPDEVTEYFNDLILPAAL
jgi:hypothetical protein